MDKELSPMQARTEAQVCALRRVNLTAGDFWLLLDSESVTLCHQRAGESPEAVVTIPRAEFNKLVRWYTKPQKPAKAQP